MAEHCPVFRQSNTKFRSVAILRSHRKQKKTVFALPVQSRGEELFLYCVLPFPSALFTLRTGKGDHKPIQ